MISSAARKARRWSCLMLGALLLLTSGCSLGMQSARVSVPTFEGKPQIHIASPLSNQSYLAGTTVIVQARIENAGPDLARISILLDGTVLGEQQYPDTGGAAIVPVTMDWLTSNSGQYEIAVETARADGDIARETVTISVISETADDQRLEPVEQNREPAPAEQPRQHTPLPPPAATTAVLPPVSSVTVDAMITKPANLRFGPGTNFDLVGSIAVNENVQIVAVNPSRDWYRIHYGDLGDAWIYSKLLLPDGDVSDLAVHTGPPAQQPESVSADGAWVNLVIEDIDLQPPEPVCNEEAIVVLTIRNLGTAATTSFGSIVLQDSRASTGEVLGNPLPSPMFQFVPAGGSLKSNEIPVKFTVHTNEEHDLVVTIDSENAIAETIESDNRKSQRFQLQHGDCP